MAERVTALAELADGKPMGFVLSTGARVCLVRVGQDVYALLDRCAHADFPMSDGELVDDYRIECSLHGAQFDIRTGAVLDGPADEGIRPFPVRVEHGDVWVTTEPA